MTWRSKRQLSVIGIALTPIVLVLLWISYGALFPNPSCFDNKKNQQEQEVDCGGPCGPCELKHPKNIVAFWARALPIRENIYDLVAYIQNPNEALSSANVEYQFTFLDRNGIIGTKSGSTFMYAQEKVHIIEPNIQAARVPTAIDFEVKRADWQFRQDPQPNILIEKKDFRITGDTGQKATEVETSLLNRAPFPFKEVEVRFILSDTEGNVRATNRVLVENLASGEHRTVKSLWPTEITGVETIEIEPRVNIFN